MTIRAAPPPGAVVLRVDATVHAAEVARFTRFVVRRPGRRDCWLWVGAIADGLRPSAGPRTVDGAPCPRTGSRCSWPPGPSTTKRSVSTTATRRCACESTPPICTPAPNRRTCVTRCPSAATAAASPPTSTPAGATAEPTPSALPSPAGYDPLRLAAARTHSPHPDAAPVRPEHPLITRWRRCPAVISCRPRSTTPRSRV